jgi:RNA polymerase sigma factor (sigma-70 family)
MSVVSGEPRVLAPSVRPLLAVPRRLLRMRSDAVLAERVAAGDETAFDVLYERHRPVVLAVCMGVLGAAHDAEDATQETFTALSIALRNNIPAELRPWLIRVARNASIDTTRRRKHRLLTIDGELPEIPARPTTGKAEFAVVMDGIRELPEQQRTALLMRELGGHSYAEIGDFMELDDDAVRGLIARARVGLRTYREATELPCATARSCIETEPDGRRYDKTIRRHLRGCSSCRSYRTALRGDAKALRAALPLQTGAFGGGAGGGLATGALSASKAALVGAGMTQIAATCAASVCAVGTVGGMVLIAPVHQLLADHLAKPAAMGVAKPHHHHVSHAAAAVHKSAVVPVSSYVAPYEPVVAPTTEKKSTGAVRHARSQKHPGSSRSGGTHHTNKGIGFGHRTPPASTGPHQSANPAAPTSAPTQPVSTAGDGTGTQTIGKTIGTSTTGSTWGSSGAGKTYGTTNSPSGTGGGTSATTNAGAGTTSTPTAQSPLTPITNTVNNVVHTVATGLNGQSPSSSTDQSTTPAATPPLGLSGRRTVTNSNWGQHGAPAANTGWSQHSAPASAPGSGQHSAPTSTPGSGQQSAPTSTPGWGQQGAPTSNPGWGQHGAPAASTGSRQSPTPWRGAF